MSPRRAGRPARWVGLAPGACLALGLVAAACSTDPGAAPGAAPAAGARGSDARDATLALGRSLALPGVEGRIDHLALDAGGQRLFVAALGNDTLEVVDLAGARTTTIRGLAEPQGVVLVPGLGRLFVTSGEGAAADGYDAATLAHVAHIALADDPDNVRYDAAARRVFVGHGAGAGGAIGSFDPATGARGADIPLAGHPESFQLEARGTRLFVNVPSARHVAVIDRVRGAVVATWSLEGAGDNYPLALDEPAGRLFVGCRTPPLLLILETRDGRPVQALDCIGDADDVFCDAAARRIYVSGGAGAIAVFQERGPDDWERLADVPTADGARTSLFDAATRTLWLAVPHRGSQRAEVREYRAP